MKAREVLLALVAILVPCILSSCGPAGEGIEIDYGRSIQPIYGGRPVDAPEHDAVVALLQVKNDRASFFCSGTLIRPNVVLSAAHCLKGMKANQVYVSNIRTLANGLPLVQGKTISVHPKYSSRTMKNDIAMLKLVSDYPNVTPVPEAPANIGLQAGEPLNFVGYGETDTGSFGTKLQADSNLDAFGCNASKCGCEAPPGDTNSMFCYDQRQNGPCFGDSGGPAFVTRGARVYVAGMTSYGDSYCTVYGVSSRADTAEAFIHDFAGAN